MSVKLHVIGPARSPDFGVELDFNGVDVVLGAVPGDRAPRPPRACLDLARRCRRRSGTSPRGSRLRSAFRRDRKRPRPSRASRTTRRCRHLARAGRGRVRSRREGRRQVPARPPDADRVRGARRRDHARGDRAAPDRRRSQGAPRQARACRHGRSRRSATLKWDGERDRAGQVAAPDVQRVARRRAIDPRGLLHDRSSLSVKAGAGLFDLGGEFILHGARVLRHPGAAVQRQDRRGLPPESGSRRSTATSSATRRATASKFALGKINPETSRFEVRFDDGCVRFAASAAGSERSRGDPRARRQPGPGLGDAPLRGRSLGSPQRRRHVSRARGDLSIRARNVVSLPVFYKMFNSLDVLSVFEKNDPWTKVEVDFAMKDRVVRHAEDPDRLSRRAPRRVRGP